MCRVPPKLCGSCGNYTVDCATEQRAYVDINAYETHILVNYYRNTDPQGKYPSARDGCRIDASVLNPVTDA